MTTATDLPRMYFNPAPAVTFPGAADARPLDFHRRLPGYAPTPLVRAPHLAHALGVREAWVKDESSRLGLPAYKILGASWATYRELDARFGPLEPWSTLDDLAEKLRPHRPITLVAATDGNHGRAVARVARLLGLSALILVPQGMVQARVDAITSEGARVDAVSGTYDEAVQAAAQRADGQHLVISDTAWAGYERVPTWVVEGYSTIFMEIDAQLAGQARGQPEVVAV